MAQTLPHRCGFGIGDTPPVIEGVLRIGDLLHPIGEASEKLSVVVREAGREVEGTFRSNGSHGARGHAQLAFQARVVSDRPIVLRGFAFHENRTQQHKVAKSGVDQIPKDSHVTKPGLDRNRLMRHNPDGAAALLIHLHGGIRVADAAILEFRDDRGSDPIDLMARVTEFKVGDGARRTAH